MGTNQAVLSSQSQLFQTKSSKQQFKDPKNDSNTIAMFFFRNFEPLEIAQIRLVSATLRIFIEKTGTLKIAMFCCTDQTQLRTDLFDVFARISHEKMLLTGDIVKRSCPKDKNKEVKTKNADWQVSET